MPTTTNIRQLKINKLTEAQYEQAVKSADELYLTPDTPKVVTITDTIYSLAVAENTIYEFSNAITSLTITSAVKSYLDSMIYFTTGSGSSIAFADNSTLKWGGGAIPSLEANTTYCIAIKNGLAEIDKFGR